MTMSYGECEQMDVVDLPSYQATAQQANAKADQNATEVSKLKRKVAYLEWKVLPHHRKHHHHAPANSQPKTNNS